MGVERLAATTVIALLGYVLSVPWLDPVALGAGLVLAAVSLALSRLKAAT
ncbi:hypothetical protein [Flindersiella endophytica]